MAAFPSTQSAAPEADLTRELYEQYAPQILRYCLHQLGSREEAEDAVQSTFLNAFRGIQRGVVPELESAWLFKIAHNVCLSRRRSSWRRGRIESPTDFELVGELAPAPPRRADELIGLQDVLEGLPEQQRRAILLREWQGLSYREISEELELSQAAVETLIFRARRSLARGLEEPAPPAKQAPGRRLAPAGVLGNLVANLLSSAQSFLLGGGAAVKVAATVAVVGAGTVAATAPVRHHRPPAPAVRRAAPVRPSVRPVVPVVAVTTAPAAVPVARPLPAVRHAPAHHRRPAVARALRPVASTPAVAATTTVVAADPAPVVQPEPVAQVSQSTPAPERVTTSKRGERAATPEQGKKQHEIPPGHAKKQEAIQPVPVAPTAAVETTPADTATDPAPADPGPQARSGHGKSDDAPGRGKNKDKE